jgi:hypothetical protein
MVHYGALWYTNARYSALWPVKVIGVLKLYIYTHTSHGIVPWNLT